MKRQLEAFLFNPVICLSEEGKWLLAVTSFEVSIITDEKNSFSITIPGHWPTKSAEQTTNELNKLLELKSQNGIELHVKEVRKRVNQMKTGDKEYEFSKIDTQKNEIIEELKNVKYNGL